MAALWRKAREKEMAAHFQEDRWEAAEVTPTLRTGVAPRTGVPAPAGVPAPPAGVAAPLEMGKYLCCIDSRT